MNQYNVIYRDKSTELVEAYDYKWDGRNALFDLGHGETKLCQDVRIVEVLP